MLEHASTTSTSRGQTNTLIAGFAIACATLLSILFVALDEGASGATPLAIMQSMLKMRDMKALVHGVAIASVLAYAFGYASLAARLDLRRPLVLAGLTTYLIGCVAMIGATILDGFISTDVAAQFVKASPEGIKLGYNLIVFLGVAITDLAKLGWVLQACAALAWAIVLIAERGLYRTVGLIGLLSGGLVLTAVLASGANMSLTAILSILLAQAIWNLAAATLLIRRSGAPGLSHATNHYKEVELQMS
ncbi:MAG: hypothetical protein V4447_01290 [Pseudomonadota bacterium]